MPVLNHPQDASPDVRRAFPQGLLVVHACPVAAQAACLGKSLIACGAMAVAGDYECNIRTEDWAIVEATLKPSAVTGTFAWKLQRLWAAGDMRSEVAGANFIAGTSETLNRIDLNGTQRCRVIFTIPGGGSVTFVRAEYNGA